MRNRYCTANKNVYFLLPVFISTEQVNAISIFGKRNKLALLVYLLTDIEVLHKSRNKTAYYYYISYKYTVVKYTGTLVLNNNK